MKGKLLFEVSKGRPTKVSGISFKNKGKVDALISVWVYWPGGVEIMYLAHKVLVVKGSTLSLATRLLLGDDERLFFRAYGGKVSAEVFSEPIGGPA